MGGSNHSRAHTFVPGWAERPSLMLPGILAAPTPEAMHLSGTCNLLIPAPTKVLREPHSKIWLLFLQPLIITPSFLSTQANLFKGFKKRKVLVILSGGRGEKSTYP